MSDSTATRKRILLVDDDTDVAHLLGFVLRRAGYDVKHASSARKAMQEVAEEVPDLFILDLWMPELDGKYLLRWLREDQGLGEPVLMLTGTVKPGLDDELKAAGANAVAHKPVDIQSLSTLVRGLLEQ